jgi:hypothetical protein
LDRATTPRCSGQHFSGFDNIRRDSSVEKQPTPSVLGDIIVLVVVALMVAAADEEMKRSEALLSKISPRQTLRQRLSGFTLRWS